MTTTLPYTCNYGHEYTPENTYIHSDGWRRCRACNREQQNRRRQADLATNRATKAATTVRVYVQPKPTPAPVDETADAWMNRALCAETDPEIFTGDQGDSSAAAKKICAKCPVVGACLQWALDHDEKYSVWGGLSPKGRKALKKKKAS